MLLSHSVVVEINIKKSILKLLYSTLNTIKYQVTFEHYFDVQYFSDQFKTFIKEHITVLTLNIRGIYLLTYCYIQVCSQEHLNAKYV